MLFALLLLSFPARAQMNDSNGGLATGGLDNPGNEQNFNTDGDSTDGAVSNTMRRGCVDASDPNAATSGLPPCTSSDNSDSNSNQPDQATPSTLSGAPSLSGTSSFSGASSAMRGTQGFANTINKQSMATVIQQLGISPDELGSLKSEMATGGLSPDDMQELCLHFAAKQLSANDVAGIAKSLGMNFTDQQLAQLRTLHRSCGTRWIGRGGVARAADGHDAVAVDVGKSEPAESAGVVSRSAIPRTRFRDRAGRAEHSQPAAIRLLAVCLARLDLRSGGQRPG